MALLVARGYDRSKAEQLERIARSAWARRVRTIGAGLLGASVVIALAIWRWQRPDSLWPGGAGLLFLLAVAVLGIVMLVAGDRFALTLRPPTVATPPTVDPRALAAHRVEPELQMPPPRPVSYPPFGYALVALAPLMVVVLVILGWQTESRHVRFLEALRRDGIQTTGHVISRHTVSGKSTSYYVDYEYRVGRLSYRGSWRSRRDYDRIAMGAEVPVTYLPRYPAASLAIRKADLTDEYVSRDRYRWLGVMLLPVGMGALLVIFFAVRARSYRRFAAYGLAVPGVILGTTPRGKFVEMRYAVDDGAPRIQAISSRLAAPLVPGDTITVLVDPDDRLKSIPYLAIQRIVRVRAGF